MFDKKATEPYTDTSAPERGREREGRREGEGRGEGGGMGGRDGGRDGRTDGVMTHTVCSKENRREKQRREICSCMQLGI